VRVFPNMNARILGGWRADRSRVCQHCLACFFLIHSLDCLSNFKVEGGDHPLGLQFEEVQLTEPFLPNSLRRCQLAGSLAFACLTICAHGAGLQQEVVSRARELNVVVHTCQGIGQPPVEVFLILHTDGAGASTNVCENCTFPSSSNLVLLPTPF